MSNMPGRSSLFALLLLLSCSVQGVRAADPALRPDGLILNETLQLAPGAVATWPLYLTRRGEYYVEILRERAPDAPALPRAPLALELAVSLRRGERELLAREFATTLELAVSLRRGERELLAREFATTLDPGRPQATLLWFTSDREVPLKRTVDFTLALAVGEPRPAERLRVQVRRKAQLIPPR